MYWHHESNKRVAPDALRAASLTSARRHFAATVRKPLMDRSSMATQFNLQALTAEVKSAQDDAQSIQPITARYPDFDLGTAYRVAHRVHQSRVDAGAKRVGCKIGFTNPSAWKALDVDRVVWGHVYDSTLISEDELEVTCSLAKLVQPRIEPEIVFGFGNTPKPGAGQAAVLDCIEWIAHGFEIVQSHYPEWKFKASDAVADAALHGALIIGPKLPFTHVGEDWVALLERFEVELSCDGELAAEGKGSNVLGSPVKALMSLLEVLAGQPDYAQLQAGEMVTTGSLTAAQDVQPGQVWKTTLHSIALPELEVTFTV